MSIRDLMHTPVQTCTFANSITEIAQQMVEHSVGALVVTDPGSSKPKAIVTDRDLVRIIGKGFAPDTSLEGAMPPAVEQVLITADVDENLRAIADKMRDGGVRRIPLVDAAGDLAGIVSLDDLLVLLGHQTAEFSQILADVSGAVKTEFMHEHVTKAGFSWFKS